MAGNFWHGSHCSQWLLNRVDVLRERQTDYAHLLGLGGVGNASSGASSNSQKICSGGAMPPLKPDQLAAASQDYQKILIFFTNFIQTLGEQLKLRQQVIATATVYMKRFYSQNSLRSIDPLLLAPTAVFLASKIEEFGVISNTRLINTCSCVVKNKFAYAYPNQDFPYRSNHILECEFFLLESMDCSLVVFQPYRPLIHFVQDLVSGGFLSDEQCTVRLLPVAWRLLNDSLRTDASLFYAPYQIALAVLHIASVIVFGGGNNAATSSGNMSESLARTASNASNISDSTEMCSVRHWFQELHVSLDVIRDISRMLLGLYQLWRSFDLRKDMSLLLQKMPKPRTSPPLNQPPS